MYKGESLCSFLVLERDRNGGLVVDVRHHDTQDPAVYAEESHTG